MWTRRSWSRGLRDRRNLHSRVALVRSSAAKGQKWFWKSEPDQVGSESQNAVGNWLWHPPKSYHDKIGRASGNAFQSVHCLLDFKSKRPKGTFWIQRLRARARTNTHLCFFFWACCVSQELMYVCVCVCLFVCVDCWCFDANYFLVSMMFEGHMTENDFDSSFHANIRTSVIRKHAAFDACQLFTNAMYMINL